MEKGDGEAEGREEEVVVAVEGLGFHTVLMRRRRMNM